MKLLIDMNLSPRWEAVLQSNGMDACHWSRLGMANAPDSSILLFARQNGFTILTSDLDFGIALAINQVCKPSVIQLRASDLRPEALSEFVIRALLLMRDEIEAGALITIEPERTRLRVLPLQRSRKT